MQPARYYILDEQGNPVPEYDATKWANWYEHANCSVASTFLANEAIVIHVSTIFLALTHPNKKNMDITSPDTMLYETMVFADGAILQQIMKLAEADERSIIATLFGGIDFQIRYATKQEAEAGHKHLCEFVQLCLDRKLLVIE